MRNNEVRCNRKSAGNLKHHYLTRTLARNGSALAKALQPVGSDRKIAQNVNFLACFVVKCAYFDSGNNVYPVALTYYLASHRSCKAVMVGYGNRINTAFLRDYD